MKHYRNAALAWPWRWAPRWRRSMRKAPPCPRTRSTRATTPPKAMRRPQRRLQDLCLKQARADKDVAEAQAKAGKQKAEANHDAAKARQDADYDVAKKKCAAMSGDAKDACLAEAKTRYGK